MLCYFTYYDYFFSACGLFEFRACVLYYVLFIALCLVKLECLNIDSVYKWNILSHMSI